MTKRTKYLSLVLFVFILTLGRSPFALAQISSTERQALVWLYEQTGGEQWKVNTGWKTPPLAPDGFALPGTENNWYGVTCDRSNTKVVALQLRQAGLEGESLHALAGLTNLRTLDLSDNRLSGDDFSWLGLMPQMRNLFLHQNVFRGNIMPFLAPLTELRRLNLGHNQFSDWDLSPLSALPALTYLNLGSNGFRGWIPDFLGQAQQLEHLDLSHNRFEGWFNLYFEGKKWVDLSGNQLAWDPCSLAGADQLVHFDFSDNRRIGFTGPLHAPRLTYLDLSNTDVVYMPGIANLDAIETINMQNCRAMGFDISPFFNLPTVKHMDLSHNRLGEEHGFIPDLNSLNSMTAIEYLDLSHNHISSDDSSLRLHDLLHLKYLDLSHNDLTFHSVEFGGTVPLVHVDLSHNALEQEPWLQNATDLQYYDVSHNRIAFSYLSLFDNAPQLRHYNISHNKMTVPYGMGPFPWVSNENLAHLDMSHNFFRFYDLQGLSNLSGLVYLNLSHNQIEGGLPHDIERLRALRVLNLSGNRLSGPLPYGLGMLEHLEKLFLAKNHLDIDSLALFGGMSRLKQLHLQGNAMIGEIPRHLVDLPQLERLEVGYNALYTDDADVLEFMSAKDPDWAATQTVAPKNLLVVPGGADGLLLSWDPIDHDSGEGGYVVYASESADGPFTVYGDTGDKTVTQMEVSGLEPGRAYFFNVRTRSEPGVRSPNFLLSDESEVVSGEIAPMPPPITVPMVY